MKWGPKFIPGFEVSIAKDGDQVLVCKWTEKKGWTIFGDKLQEFNPEVSSDDLKEYSEE